MRKKSMTIQLVSLLVGAVFLCGLLSVTVFGMISRKNILHNEITKMENNATIISDIMEGFFSGEVELSVLTKQFPRERSLWGSDVYIYDMDGELFMTSQLSEEKHELEQRFIDYALHNESTREEISTRHGVYLLIGRQILNHQGTRAATVILLEPVSQIEKTMKVSRNSMLLSAVVVFLLAIPAVVLLIRRIMKPVEEMGEAANAIAEGNFDREVDDGNIVELTNLSDSFKHLSRSLDHTVSALRMERDRLRRMIEDMNEGVICINSENEIEMYNLAAVRLLDIRQEDSVSIEELVTEVLGEHLERVKVQKGKDSFEIQRADRLIHVDMVLSHGEKDQLDNILVILQDLTESRRLQQIQDDYAANVSHEVRSPLTTIRALIEPLNDGLVNDEETKRKYYSTILHETERMARLITDISELGRLRSGSVVISKCNVDMTEVFEEIRLRYSVLTREKNLQLEMEIPDVMEPVYTNPDRVEQCLAALLDNAIKYTNENGKIEIRVSDRGDDILISVKDNGIGIPEQDIPHVFERFFQVDRSHRAEGNGLGLAITQLIIEGMGEKIRVSSVEGQGSTFSFTVHRLPGWKNLRNRKMGTGQ